MHAGLVLGIVSGISSFCSATPLAFKGDVKPRPGYTIYNAYDIDLDSAEYGTCKVHRNRIWKAFSETAELINAGREAIVALRHPRPAEGEAAESWRRKADTLSALFGHHVVEDTGLGAIGDIMLGVYDDYLDRHTRSQKERIRVYCGDKGKDGEFICRPKLRDGMWLSGGGRLQICHRELKKNRWSLGMIKPEKGHGLDEYENSLARTWMHELGNLVLPRSGTDFDPKQVYGWDRSADLAKSNPAAALESIENYSLFALAMYWSQFNWSTGKAL